MKRIQIKKDKIQLIVVDLFCGAGGTTSGIEQCKDEKGHKIAKVVCCVNHDPKAINCHYLNFPDVDHFTDDIKKLRMRKLVRLVAKYRQIYPNAKLMLWASLECTNFSNAKGGKARDRDSRMLAWELFRYIGALKPEYIQIENVREFMAWGELDSNGKPLSRTNGKIFQKWIKRICEYGGYHVDWKLLNSANYGAYTSRTRLFMIFAKIGLPIAWPKATHSKNAKKDAFGELKPWKSVREVLELGKEGISIFNRPLIGKKPLVDNTLKRILAGLEKFACLDTAFLVRHFSGNSSDKSSSLSFPAHTLTTIDHHNLVNVHFLDEYYGHGKPHHIEKPLNTITTRDRQSLIKVSFLDNQYKTGHSSSIDQPSGTLTTVPKQGLVNVHFLQQKNGGNPSSKSFHLNRPSRTITCTDQHQLKKISRNFLFNPQFSSKGSSIEKPAFTLIAKMDKRPPGIVTAKIGLFAFEFNDSDTKIMKEIKRFCKENLIKDVKMRGLFCEELKKIQGFDEDFDFGDATQTNIKKFIGNSVVPIMSRVINECLISRF